MTHSRDNMLLLVKTSGLHSDGKLARRLTEGKIFLTGDTMIPTLILLLIIGYSLYLASINCHYFVNLVILLGIFGAKLRHKIETLRAQLWHKVIWGTVGGGTGKFISRYSSHAFLS